MVNFEIIENEEAAVNQKSKKMGRPRKTPEEKPLARSLYLPKEVWEILDEHCKKIHMSRNAYLMSLILNAIENKNKNA